MVTPGTVKIFGNNVPKPVAIGGGIVLFVGGVYYYRKNRDATANAASVAAAGTDEIDPATGYPYGSAEDAAALDTQNNYAMAGGTGGGYGYTGYSGGSGSGIFGAGQPGSFNSNAEWSQYVQAYEINNLGGDAPTIANAIGKYITGQPLTTDTMVSIVQSAIAIAGYPPVSGPNGNPPSFTTGVVSTPDPTPTPKPTPAPTPTPAPSAIPVTVTGLHKTTVGKTSIGIAWNASKNAKSYQVRVTYQTQVVQTHMTSATSYSIGGLSSNRTYGLHVVAINGSQWAPEASIVQKTS